MGIVYKKTGLYYQTRLDKVNDHKIHYLKKNKDLSFDQGGIHHKLIIGDNYHALKNLLITYKNKIDIIYIDPPYGCDSMGEFAKTNYDNQITRDNLLSMLEPRLKIAKELLSSQGVIFCSVDDKNQAYIKCLFDDIFGENNFLANFTRKTSDSHSGEGAKISNKCDYILFYGKKSNDAIQTVKTNYEFPFEDKNGKYKLTSLLAAGNHSTNVERPNCYYPIYVSNDLKIISLEKKNNFIEVFPPKKKGRDVSGRWNWGKDWEIKEFISNYKLSDEDLGKTNINLIVAKKNKSGNIEMFRKHYEKDNSNGKKTYKSNTYGNIIEDFPNASASRMLTSIFLKKVFDYPKPIELIKHLLTIVQSKNSIILDFFAGSGTTGHAVLDFNKEDNGNRKFILVSLNENIDELLKIANKESIEILNNAKQVLKECNLPNEISSLTYERCKRIMSGKSSDESKFKWIEKAKQYGDSLDVYNIKDVDIDNKKTFEEIDPEDYDVRDKTTTKNKIEWICDNFEELTWTLKEKSND